jgi:hypothetical protein
VVGRRAAIGWIERIKTAEARVEEIQTRKIKAQAGIFTVRGETIAQRTAELAM